jgi:hypothetical protein
MEALTSSPELDFSRAAARVFGSWKPREIHLDVPLGRLAYVRRPDVIGRRATPFLLAEFALTPPAAESSRQSSANEMRSA